MRKVTKPLHSPSDTYLTCIARVRKNALKLRLTNIEPDIVALAEEFDEAGVNTNIHSIEEHSIVGADVTIAEMEAIYTDRMAKEGAPGREIYNEIKSLAEICPFCGERLVSTLDHYLPKAKFPGLAVVPVNLAPACYDCNFGKRTKTFQHQWGELFHPYYDDFDDGRWLAATVIEKLPAAVIFHVRKPSTWDHLTYLRAYNHFSFYDLNTLYASKAGEEINGIRAGLRWIFNEEGAEGVKQHLYGAFLSREEARLNSWMTATYEALANSYWFCEGGFESSNSA